jgi:hypothetical protein
VRTTASSTCLKEPFSAFINESNTSCAVSP